TLEDLEQAAREGRLRAMPGMGARKEAQILKALEDRRPLAGRRRAAKAYDHAAALVENLRGHSPAADVQIVGSLRRGCDTCGDIDILAAVSRPEEDGAPLMRAFTDYRLVERVLAHGHTKCSVLLQDRFQADIRIVPRESLGAAMQYFTGSKAHNIALRDRAVRRSLKLNEYGLFTLDTDERLAGDTEEGIYRALDLAFVPPELR